LLGPASGQEAFDSRSVDCPLVFRANLIDWRREGCTLRRDPASPVTRYNIAMNWIVRRNELRSPGELKNVIGLCRSTDLTHWEIEAPCLRPEDGANWESGLYKPCLVENQGTYYLFYNARTKNLPRSQVGGWIEQTGVTISRDLKTWTRWIHNPIIPVGAAGSPDERFASDPCVLMDGRRWGTIHFTR
jgi:predicted GH43/DUF377 family glycosyl hydrolase